MHIHQLSIIDHKAKEGIIRFSELPFQTSLFNLSVAHHLMQQSEGLVKAYLVVLTAQNIFSKDHQQYYRKKLLLKHSLDAVEIKHGETIHEEILQSIHQFVISYFENNAITENKIFPIHLHFSTFSDLYLMTGIGFCDKEGKVFYSSPFHFKIHHYKAIENKQIQLMIHIQRLLIKMINRISVLF